MKVKHIIEQAFKLPLARIIATGMLIILYFIFPYFLKQNNMSLIEYNYFLTIGFNIMFLIIVFIIWGDYEPTFEEKIVHKEIMGKGKR